jgi:hypothetical protein
VTYVIAGVTSGLLMASLFVVLAPIMLFFISKNPTSRLQVILDKVTPLRLVMGVIILSYPFWTIVGIALALGFALVSRNGFDFGYTVCVVIISTLVFVPLGILLRKVLWGVVTLASMFIIIFGYILPWLVR